MSERRPHWLDRPVARLGALFVLLAAIAALVEIERRQLFREEAAPAPAETAYDRCYAERTADVEPLLQDKTITEEQAALFRRRADDFCRAQTPQE